MKMCEENLTALYIKPDPIWYIFRLKVASPLQKISFLVSGKEEWSTFSIKGCRYKQVYIFILCLAI